MPDTILELIKQRRRWLNGAFFSLVYYITKFHRCVSAQCGSGAAAAGFTHDGARVAAAACSFTSDAGHSLPRRLALYVQFFYMLVNMILAWFAVRHARVPRRPHHAARRAPQVAALFLSMAMIYHSSFDQVAIFGKYIIYAFYLVYGILVLLQVRAGAGGPGGRHALRAGRVVSQVLMGLGGKAKDVAKIYWVCSMVFGLIMYSAIGLSMYISATSQLNYYLVIAILTSAGSNAVCSFFHQEMIVILMTYLQYIFMVRVRCRRRSSSSGSGAARSTRPCHVLPRRRCPRSRTCLRRTRSASAPAHSAARADERAHAVH